MTGPCALVSQVVDALLAAGYVLNVTIGDGIEQLPDPTDDRTVLLAALATEADTHYLIAYSNRHPALTKTRSTGWVRLVHFTTDPEDLISDFTLTLAPYIEPLIARDGRP